MFGLLAFMVFFDVVDDDGAHVRARHVPVEVHLGEGGTRVVVLAPVVVEGATELTKEQFKHLKEKFHSRGALNYHSQVKRMLQAS